MQVISPGAVDTFENLPAGAAFICTVGKKNYLCLKVIEHRGGDGVPWCLALAHPEYGGLPGLWADTVITDPVLRLTDVRFRAEGDAPGLLLGTYAKVAGQVVLVGNRMIMLVAVDKDGLGAVDVLTGEFNPQVPGPKAGLGKWSIERGLGDDAVTLLSYPPKSAG